MNDTAPHTVIDLRGATTPAMERARRYATSVRPRSVQPQTPPVLHPQPAPRVSTRLILASFARMALVGALILGGYQVQPWVASSLAYFSDTEAAPASVAASSILDIEAGEDGSSDIMCGGDTSFPVTVDFTSTRAASYEVQALYKDGDVAFCELLDVEATFDDLEQYEGDLIGGAGLYVGGLTATGTWDFDVSLGTEGVSVPDGTTCSVDLVFRAWCPLLGAYGSGFHDEDRVTLTLTKNGCTGGHCEEPCTGGCGDVYIEVENNNSAEVENTVLIETNTGGNSANGGAGGDGGSSGESGEGGEGGTGSTGNGGDGGNGGEGGTVVTGSTNASVNISQAINSNSTSITTGCSGCCTLECPSEKSHGSAESLSSSTPRTASSSVGLPDTQTLLNSIQGTVRARFGR